MNELTQFFKILSDETRVRILLLLKSKNRLCVCQLQGIMNESQPKISKHLAKLRDFGLIKDERSEQFIYYSLNITNPLFEQVLDLIEQSKKSYSSLLSDDNRSIDIEQYKMNRYVRTEDN
jgi:ArsR family transcriptional regulator, arsenate/arsenite/antimonite-responsive transcriptional repressor